MRFLHTSDWHVGKTLKGLSRLEEQRAVLGEVVRLAREHEVDAVLIAGDLYDSGSPSPEAQKLVVQVLLALRGTGAEVVAIAGNHDNASIFEAYRPLMREVGITLVGNVRTAAQGGVVRFDARSTGEPVTLAVLPFLSQRYAVTASQIVNNTPAENAGSYDQRVREVLATLTAGFDPGAVNLVMAHLTITGGQLGGGERAAQSIFEYHVPATVFPAEAHYVAAGHLHRRQTIPAACPVVYCGSPIAVDFGEGDNTQVVCLVEATPTTPARITDLPLTSARRLRTVRGTVAELLARQEEFGDDYLRVFVREKSRAGLTEAVQDALPNALEVRIDPEFAVVVHVDRPPGAREERSPAELFAAYLTESQVDDARLTTLFAELQDEVG